MIMFLLILKWVVIVDIIAAILFGLMLVHDRIKYGVWAADYPKGNDNDGE